MANLLDEKLLPVSKLRKQILVCILYLNVVTTYLDITDFVYPEKHWGFNYTYV